MRKSTRGTVSTFVGREPCYDVEIEYKATHISQTRTSPAETSLTVEGVTPLEDDSPDGETLFNQHEDEIYERIEDHLSRW